ncbi:hypothetical protein QBC43DRAFT_202752 [Cladorrhinum sp. PSN259]|nr:hypothetical protein QBC43DRAFT_202752 [Cladorrhinum sp. PSN259]
MPQGSLKLRLRLVIQRHALPEVRIVFSCKTDNDPTVAGLLEQVNGIVPLESAEWGLEDYTVELRKENGLAFDCLHFQEVADVFDPDEEVYIRPLVTEDRRKRRLSGRDQISAAGRHLIDGIPFGRPRLRAPQDRPPVEIPSLKRRRDEYEQDQEDDEEPQFLITQHGEAKRQRRGNVRFDLDLDDDDDDSDFEGGAEEEAEESEDDGLEDLDEALDEEEEESELEDELEALLKDNKEVEDHVAEDLNNIHCKSLEGQRTLDLDVLDKITALQAAYKGIKIDVVQDVLTQNRDGLIASYNKLREFGTPKKSLREMLAHYQSLRLPTETPEELLIQNAEASDAECVDSVVKHYDQHGFPSGSILDGTASRHMAEELRKSGKDVNMPVHIKFGDSNGDSSESEDDFGGFDDQEDEDVELSGPSDEDAVLDEDAAQSDNQSESENDSDSSNDSGPEVASSKQYPKLSGSASSSDVDDSEESDSDVDSDGSSDGDDDGDDDSDEESEDESDGGMALDSDHEDINEDDDADDGADGGHGDASSEASASDSESDQDSSSENDSSSGDRSGNESSGDDSSSSDEESVSDIPRPRSEEQTTASVPSSAKVVEPSVRKSAPTEPPAPVIPGQGKRSTQKRNARRRALLSAKKAAARGESVAEPIPEHAAEIDASADIAASIAAKKAAMLERLNGFTEMLVEELEGGAGKDKEGVLGPVEIMFGALGVKNPKTKEDEDKVRSSLMADVRPHVTHRLLDSAKPVEEELVQAKDVQAEVDPEAWREKINYRAVECCQEGVELSEPPFPFVQRWDPQQQYFRKDNKRGGRSKRKQRDQADFQDDSRLSAKRRKYGDNNGDDDESVCYDNSTLNYDESTANGETILNYDDEPQETREHENAEDHDEMDLPPLPDDLSTLPAFVADGAIPGMILTWKQLLMSKATNWQPQVISLTAIIVNVEAGNSFRVRLAKRDRMLDQNEKVYDEDGNRVYDKFEMVGMDEEDEESEQGYRTVEFDDMMEPRILQYPDNVVPNTPSAQQSQNAPPLSDEDGNKITSAQTSATFGRDEQEKQDVNSLQTELDAQRVDESVIPDSGLRTSDQQQPSQTHSDLVEDVSMTEDRRNEISQLIKDAGFRKEVDPCITEAARSDRSSNSPSRQLADMSHEVLPVFESSQQHNQVEIGVSQTTSNGVDSQPILLRPFNGFSDGVDAPRSEGRVQYPNLAGLPRTSDAGSVRSGRQVDPDFSIDLGDSSFNQFQSSPPPQLESEAEDDKPTPRPSPAKRERSISASSNDSFPSLSEFPTQSSSNRSQSAPANSVTAAVKNSGSVVKNVEYEEAMRRLDEESEEEYNAEPAPEEANEDDGFETGPSTLARKLVEKPIEKPSPKKPVSSNKGSAITGKRNSMAPIKAEPGSSYPQKGTRNSLSSSSQPFQIPEGSQVFSLLSSSPEPLVEENYAEDDIDETYLASEQDTGSSLPHGSGWVEKNKKKKQLTLTKRKNFARGVSMPAPASSLGPAREKESVVPKRFASSQASRVPGRPGSGESSQKALAGGLLKARQKLGGRKF